VRYLFELGELEMAHETHPCPACFCFVDSGGRGEALHASGAFVGGQRLKLDWHDSARDRLVPVKLNFPRGRRWAISNHHFLAWLGWVTGQLSYVGKHWAGCGYVSVHVQHLGSDDGVWRDVSLAERAKALQKAAMNISNATKSAVGCAVCDGRQTGEVECGQHFAAERALGCAGLRHRRPFVWRLHHAGAGRRQTFTLPLGRSKRYDEPRLKAAIQMQCPAPTRRTDSDQVYGSITVPTMHMNGHRGLRGDTCRKTKPADRRIPSDHMSAAETCLVIFNGGDHMIFSGRERQGSEGEHSQDEVFHKLTVRAPGLLGRLVKAMLRPRSGSWAAATRNCWVSRRSMSGRSRLADRAWRCGVVTGAPPARLVQRLGHRYPKRQEFCRRDFLSQRGIADRLHLDQCFLWGGGSPGAEGD